MSDELLRQIADESIGAPWREATDDARAWRSRIAARAPVTVVIPVFNGFDALFRLLECPELWNGVAEVLVVDDCSPDPRIPSLLGSIAQRRPELRILRNRRNLGFVRSVNRGLRERTAGNDVVVLNSDALVAGDWLARLVLSAYAYADVATVSPLSNAAGFFSVPQSGVVNALPEGWLAADCEAALARLSPRLHEPTVATCGFCWYLRSSALDDVGLLDEMMIHRGYAEETDFCLRADASGWKNLCCLTGYVEHAAGQSFGPEKNVLKRRNANILKAMMPRFLDSLRAYEAASAVPGLGERFRQAVESGTVGAGRIDVLAPGGSPGDAIGEAAILDVGADGGRLTIRCGGSEVPLQAAPDVGDDVRSWLAARFAPARTLRAWDSGAWQ